MPESGLRAAVLASVLRGGRWALGAPGASGRLPGEPWGHRPRPARQPRLEKPQRPPAAPPPRPAAQAPHVPAPGWRERPGLDPGLPPLDSWSRRPGPTLCPFKGIFQGRSNILGQSSDVLSSGSCSSPPWSWNTQRPVTTVLGPSGSVPSRPLGWEAVPGIGPQESLGSVITGRWPPTRVGASKGTVSTSCRMGTRGRGTASGHLDLLQRVKQKPEEALGGQHRAGHCAQLTDFPSHAGRATACPALHSGEGAGAHEHPHWCAPHGCVPA